MSQHEDPYNPYAAPLAKPGVGKPSKSGAEEIRKRFLSHEASIRSFGFLFLLGGILALLAGIGMIFVSLAALAEEDEMAVFFLVMCPVYIGLGGLQLFVGLGLRKLNQFGRIGGTVLGAIGLLGIPIGTLINGYLLYLLWSEKGTYIFTPEYQQIRLETPHIKYKTSIIVWILLAILLGFIFVGVIAVVLSG